MARRGLFGTIRELFREFREFGNADLEQAKQSILHLKAEIAQLRETSRTFEAVKERVTEQALKRSMAAVRNQEAVAKQQAAAMSRAFAELDTVMEPDMQAVAKAKAEAHVAEVMAAVDVDKFLKSGSLADAIRPGVPVPPAVARALEKEAGEAGTLPGGAALAGGRAGSPGASARAAAPAAGTDSAAHAARAPAGAAGGGASTGAQAATGARPPDEGSRAAPAAFGQAGPDKGGQPGGG